MSTPDTAAAAVDLLWKGQPLPAYGTVVSATWLDTSGRSWRTKNVTMIVRTITLTQDGSVAILLLSDGTQHARLSADRLTDKWHTVLASAPAELGLVPDFPEAVAPVIDTAAPVDAPATPAPDAAVTTLADAQRRWLWVDRQVDEADALLKTLKAERDALNEQIVEDTVLLGLDAPPALDGMTFSFSPVYYVNYLADGDGAKFGTADVIRALRKLNMDRGIVTNGYNGNTLKAMLRERIEADLGIPDELAKLVEVKNRPQVRATQSSAKRRAGARAAVSHRGRRRL
jgi:hypothetical protein